MGFEWAKPWKSHLQNGGLSIARFDYRLFWSSFWRPPHHICTITCSTSMGMEIKKFLESCTGFPALCADNAAIETVPSPQSFKLNRAIGLAGDARHDTNDLGACSFHFHVTTTWHLWSICCSMWRSAFVWIWVPWMMQRQRNCMWDWVTKPVNFSDFPTFGGDQHRCSPFSSIFDEGLMMWKTIGRYGSKP